MTVNVAELVRTIEIVPDTYEDARPGDIRVVVTYDAPGLDRKDGYAWGLPARHRALADRLVRAIEAGVVLGDPEIRTDVNGNTYVSATSRILARMMNAELRRLGF